MSKKVLIIILSSVLAVATIAGVWLGIASANKDKPGNGDSTGPGVSQSTGDSTGNNGGDNPSPDNPDGTVQKADRSKYSLLKIVLGYAQIPTYDLIVGYDDPESDYHKAVDKLFEGYMIGDIYSQVIDLAIEAAEDSDMLAGVDLNVILGDLIYYYGVDGNWYVKSSNVRTNELLNQVLNYKIDGTGELDLNLAVYGNKTLAYIFFDYTGESSSTMDIDAIIGMIVKASPIADSLLNVTLNHLVTLIDGTSTERAEVVRDVFGDLKIKDIISLTGVDLTQNKLLSATASVTFNQILELTKGDLQTLKAFIGSTYQGLTIADSVGINPSHPAYIAGLHGLSLSEYLVAMIDGTGREFILNKAGYLNLKVLFESYVALAGWEKDYTAYLQANREFFSTTLEELDELLAQFDVNTYLIYGVNDSILGVDLDAFLQDYETELALLKGAYDGFVEINGQEIDQVVIKFTGETLAELEERFNLYVDLYVQTQSAIKAAGAFIDDFYTANKQTIDALLEKYGKTYEGIKAVIQPYIEAAIESYEATGNFKTVLTTVLEAIYSDYKEPIDDFLKTEFGFTFEQVLGMINGNGGGILSGMTPKDFFEIVVLGYLVEKIPAGELINFKSLFGDTLIITQEDIYNLYNYKFALMPDPEAYDALMKDIFGEFKIGSLFDLVLTYIPTDWQIPAEIG